jgi:hypothetical protein
MKKIISCLLCCQWFSAAYALGPNQLVFDNIKFNKQAEKSHDQTHSAEYIPASNGNSKVILYHVLDKKDPQALLNSLKQKKGVEIVEVQNANNDLLVTFIRFDSKKQNVEQNLCRISPNANHRGSVVFQYTYTQKFKSQAEGIKTQDFTEAMDKIKELPLEQYISSLSQNLAPKAKEIPWYDRPGAWAGRDEYLKRRNFYRNNRFGPYQ